MMLNEEEVQNLIYDYADESGLKFSRNRLICQPSFNARPFLEINNGHYHFVINERGYEIIRKSSDDVNDFLYNFFEALVSEMAYEYELTDRLDDCYSKKKVIKKKIELMKTINLTWEARIKKELVNA